MSKLVSTSLLIAAACCLVSALPLRAEDGGNELERLLERKCAELSIGLVEARIRFKPDSQEVKEMTELLERYRMTLERQKAESREMLRQRLKEAMAQIEKEIQVVKMAGKEGGDFSRIQFFEQIRSALMKKLIEMDVGPLQIADDAQKAAEKFNKNAPQLSRAHVKLANGNEIDAEGPFLQGPFLQQSAEVRELLEQFADPAKDGAVSTRMPDQFDPDTAAQLVEMLKNVAPKATVSYNEKLRLLVATSDDPVQLRRVASVFRTLRPNNPGFDPNQKMKGDPNAGMKGQFGDGNDMKRFPPPGGMQPPPNNKGKPDMEEMRKKKDAIDDKF